MGAFDVLRIAGSGLGMHQTWLDALASNIANANTVVSTDQTAFQAQLVMAGARQDGGVDVTGIALSDPEGMLVHDPDHPLADAEGYVRAPAMDMSAQMSELIMAQRGFQASAQVTKFAQDTYSTAIGIGSR
ncbi:MULTISPECIES: flagellar basal body rod protein FlgC [Nocardioides]|uniref:Flagellar basal body rod C-terminal domain-containing protein n=1 Tax=Nocardioides kribbensis TaxID=305517 RepID=A0ABV1NX23_9ACTN|nr:MULTISPECIES: flagellar basal body rod C-terminal domain-containing protein [Nocardioides]KQP63301.1 flagellar basal-body rod protein FlgC [Nocardioides sp. Leaf285]KQQ39756.1 flagellar basal-body rod protein FlgC [Nocardioides sp. Leaf307]MBJ7528863.1 flagellar basal-body rod protein FlgC [Nocardioides sp.]MCM3514798.1 flagellar basal body protein [Nocardioides sp. P86]